MKRILSIDGGGIRGLIPALVLAEIEARTGRPIARLFDVLAGTSTGGILALGLTVPGTDDAPRYAASQLAELYRTRGGEIFHRSLPRALLGVNGWLDEKYEHAALESVLREYFGDAPLRGAIAHVMVTSYDLHNRKPRFLKSFNPEHHPIEVWRAARATAAAPTYFEPAQLAVETGNLLLVDGGVCVNNPAASAYAEAVRGWPDERSFLVLSLGTGTDAGEFDFDEARNWGKLGWGAPLIHVVFDGASDVVHYQMRHLLGDDYVRLQIGLDGARADLGDASPANIAALEADARRLIAAYDPEIDRVCERLVAVPAGG